MTVKEIYEVLKLHFGMDCRIEGNIKDANIQTLLTDSRNHFNPNTSLFFSIKTPGGNDGHRFIKSLYDRGVRNFIVQQIPKEGKELAEASFIMVPDSVEALTVVGSQHRSLAKETVAITGSRGKTTLKEIIFQLLEPLKKISRSPRSFNSKIGVPLSLWNISPTTDIALIEAGISQKGEMEHLAGTINPDTVIFTNIGEAHSFGFESKETKAAEKALLANAPMVKTVIYPQDDAYISDALNNLGNRQNIDIIRWSFKDPKAELFLRYHSGELEYSWKGEQFKFHIKLEKEYDYENIAAALAFLLKEGIDPETIKERFQKLYLIQTRMNVSEGINGCSIILDSYTSDLSSLLPAIDFMKRRKNPEQTLTLVLSDVQHEGRQDHDLYKEISQLTEETGISKIIGVGENIMQYQQLFPASSRFYKDTDTFLSSLSASDFNDEIILLKGSPEFNFKLIYDQLAAKKHETVLEVNLDAMLRNYNYFRGLVPSSVGIVAMVKASGYGAGSYEIAKTLQDAGAAYLAVAALDEGIDLRNHGIVMPIMVMNPRAANYKSLFKNNLQPVIYSMSMLHTLIEEAAKYREGEYPVHIKLDTGMHRMGFEEKDIDILSDLLSRAHNIRVSSIFSHLATADCLDMDDFTLKQLKCFETMSTKIMQKLNYPVKRHILNSAGILRFPEYHYDLVRLGIGLYGANTLPPHIEKPLSVVSTLRSVIICIREIESPETVGYSRNGKISKPSRIATIPVGYADGMNRKFGNGAIKVLVNGFQVPTIGNICMDATMIDVTGIDCKEGDSVEIFGENMSVQNLADTLDTIPYEILTSVSPRVKRVYYRE